MYFLSVLFLFLPAGLANLVPPFAAIYLPKYDQPMDFGKTFKGKRILGDHKTFRGLVTGMLMAELLFLLQIYLFDTQPFFKSLSLINYDSTSIFFGLALGFGALAGDAIKSFVKRQINIVPGASWFPWDQIDWVIGSLLISQFFISINLQTAGTYLLLGLVLHLIIKFIGFLIKMNKTVI